MEIMTIVLWVLAAYLIGSIPTGYLMGRGLKRIDIRQVGSGNPGATNVFRSVGKIPGIITLLIDAFKGWVPVWLALRYFHGTVPPVLVGLFAVTGHTLSPFLKFKGGKGVATSAGVFAALLPGPTSTALLAFAIAFGLSHYVSVGSLAGAVTLPVVAFWQAGVTLPTLLSLILGFLIIVKHISNIKRLLRGEEHAIHFKKDSPP